MADSINIEGLLSLSDGDKEFVKEILVLFREQVPIELKNLKDLMQKEDREGLSQLLHKLKSFTSPLGLKDLGAEISRLEKVAKTDDLASLQSELDDLILSMENLVERTKYQLEEIKSE